MRALAATTTTDDIQVSPPSPPPPPFPPTARCPHRTRVLQVCHLQNFTPSNPLLPFSEYEQEQSREVAPRQEKERTRQQLICGVLEIGPHSKVYSIKIATVNYFKMCNYDECN